MNGRFQRGRVGGISPFFAFQDIITSAMAVIITIVMLLALDIGEPSQAPSGEADRGDLAAQLAKVLAELSQANADLRTLQETSRGTKVDPALLRGQIVALRGDLATLQQGAIASGKQLSGVKQGGGTTVVASELANAKAQIAAANKALAISEAEVARTLAEMKNAENSLRAKEGQLLSEQAKKNELWLIPDRSKTSKEPVLAVVSANAIALQRLDQPESSEIRGRDLAGKFEEAIKVFSKLDQYIVFYFKPSGVDLFQKLTDAAKDAGFEIGYDAVSEESAIHFNPSK